MAAGAARIRARGGESGLALCDLYIPDDVLWFLHYDRLSVQNLAILQYFEILARNFILSQ